MKIVCEHYGGDFVFEAGDGCEVCRKLEKIKTLEKKNEELEAENIRLTDELENTRKHQDG